MHPSSVQIQPNSRRSANWFEYLVIVFPCTVAGGELVRVVHHSSVDLLLCVIALFLSCILPHCSVLKVAFNLYICRLALLWTLGLVLYDYPHLWFGSEPNTKTISWYECIPAASDDGIKIWPHCQASAVIFQFLTIQHSSQLSWELKIIIIVTFPCSHLLKFSSR